MNDPLSNHAAHPGATKPLQGTGLLTRSAHPYLPHRLGNPRLTRTHDPSPSVDQLESGRASLRRHFLIIIIPYFLTVEQRTNTTRIQFLLSLGVLYKFDAIGASTLLGLLRFAVDRDRNRQRFSAEFHPYALLPSRFRSLLPSSSLPLPDSPHYLLEQHCTPVDSAPQQSSPDTSISSSSCTYILSPGFPFPHSHRPSIRYAMGSRRVQVIFCTPSSLSHLCRSCSL
ncbi:hypothetical protein NMY22_g8199 [Coprinellus aureogranulatus]|nr:hypothetical protein NMY22_g8199 [Coprinellus aureogranulatus]